MVAVLQAPPEGEVESLSGYESYAGYESCDVEEEERGEEGEWGGGEAEGGEETESEGDNMAVWSTCIVQKVGFRGHI